MKQHTSDFKTSISRIGRQFDDYITYGNTTLREELYSISLHYDGGLLKSIMKQLDIESSIDIPIGTKISYKKGLLVNGAYEYLDYGSFYVYKSEKSEDKRNYNITCYDAMLFSMVEYTGMSIVFPITVRAYLTALCNKIGVPFLSSGTNFVNYNREMQVDPFVDADGNSLGFTIRDILDNLSQVTASNICIGKSGNTEGVEVRYITETNDTIDGDHLKDVNVNFGEKYGPINSIVLSRAGGSDNVYLQDEDSVEENGLCELKITDNEIMNFNDRSDYLPEILEKLDGLEYYVNDYSSTGICYYEPCDMYHIEIDDNTYQCIMFNDEINTTTGLEELVHTEIPEEAQTDYTKADKTDRRINQTYMIVDKQNQQIQAVITRTDEFDETLTQLQLDVDGIETMVSGVYDLTRKSSGVQEITLDPCMQGYLLEMHIYGNNTVFDYLFPADDLFPSDTLYPKGDSRIEVEDKDGNIVTYELRVMDVLRANEKVRDEYILKDNFAKVIRRVNPDGTTKETEEVEEIGKYTIYVSEGLNKIRIKNYVANIDAKYIIKNNYTDQFTTQIQTQSQIKQASNQIMLEVSEQYETQNDANENYSRLTQTAQEISTEVSKKVGNNEVISKINQSAEAVTINANKISLAGKTINMTSDNIAINSTNFSVDKNGNMTCTNANVSGTITSSNATISGGQINLKGNSGTTSLLRVYDNGVNNNYMSYVGNTMMGINNGSNHIELISSTPSIDVYVEGSSGTYVRYDSVTTPIVYQTNNGSDKRIKTDIKDSTSSALDKIMQIKHKQFYRKTDNKYYDIGYIAQDMEKIDNNFVLINENDKNKPYYINELPIIATLSKAIQEQQQQIEELQNEIKILKGEKYGEN